MKVLLCNNPENLSAKKPMITIEAEYGDKVVEGSVATFAHHGPRKANPCPCVDPKAFEVAKAIDSPLGSEARKNLVIGVSHVDLDTLGCLMIVLRYVWDFPMAFIDKAREFLEIAAFADLNGPHKLKREDRESLPRRQLHAWWAWNEAHRVFAPRDGSVLDITIEVEKALEVIRDIIRGNEDLLRAGEEFVAQEDSLNEHSYCECVGGVIKRVADQFVNHLYQRPVGDGAQKAVVALNRVQGSVTVSFADPIEGVSARKIVQTLWGPEAGGHDAIAGSPRNRKMTEADLNDAFRAVVEILK